MKLARKGWAAQSVDQAAGPKVVASRHDPAVSLGDESLTAQLYYASKHNAHS